jgi:putative CocE/NonD family hydrolase
VRVVTDFPRRVRTIPTVWIELADGCRLAARIWLPEDAERDPVPAILEYLPYRLNDGTAVRDSRHFPYLAGHGYACIRVDQRGTGESDGVLEDEYLPQEQSDACEVIAWLARQPWCTGKVGMLGISWSGFNSLQVAANRPPELGAIVTLCSTDDRYADDVHYDGGCISSDMLMWASSMLGWSAWPPDPEIVGERWRDMWLHRMREAPPFIDHWLGHQRRDDYWKQGSVCEDFSRIEVPVFAVGGWADGYTNAIPRLLEGLSVPRKGLIGPWAHAWPQAGPPEPTIGFLQEVVRWFDHCCAASTRGSWTSRRCGPGSTSPCGRPRATPSDRAGGWPRTAGRGATFPRACSAWAATAGSKRVQAAAGSRSSAFRPPASTPARGARTARSPTGRATSVPWTE